MNRLLWIVISVSAILSTAGSVQAQVRRGTFSAPNEVDPGVFGVTLIDRPEVRVARVDLRPGSSRRLHTHDDNVFHLLLPLDGSVQLTRSDIVTEAKPWQVAFMSGGTPHGFKNMGEANVVVIEVLIMRTDKQPADADALASIAIAEAVAVLAK